MNIVKFFEDCIVNNNLFFFYKTQFLIFFPLILYLFSLFFKKTISDYVILFLSVSSLLLINLIYLFDIFGDQIFFKSENALRLNFFIIDQKFNFEFAFNSFGISFLFISYILCILTIIYSFSYCKKLELDFSKLIRMILIAIFSVNLIALASNIFVSFIGYEVLSIVTYFLIIFANKDLNAKYIGKKYLSLLLVFSSIFFVLCFLLIFYIFNGDINLYFAKNNFEYIYDEKKYFIYSLIVCLIFFGSLKAAIFPFHFWLPSAMIAHLPVSAVLHAALVVKSGIIIIFQIIFLKIGINNLFLISSSHNKINFILLIPKILTIFGIMILSFIATRKNEIKRLLAYSTASQLNYILLSFFLIIEIIQRNFSNNLDVSLIMIECIVLIQIAVHAFSKINLFFCAGYFYEKYGIKYKYDYIGLFYKEKIISITFIVSFLSILGFPFLPGFFNKLNLVNLIIKSSDIYVLIAFIISFIFSLYYSIPIIYDMLFLKNNKLLESNNSNFSSMKFSIILCFFCLLSIIIFLGFFRFNI